MAKQLRCLELWFCCAGGDGCTFAAKLAPTQAAADLAGEEVKRERISCGYIKKNANRLLEVTFLPHQEYCSLYNRRLGRIHRCPTVQGHIWVAWRLHLLYSLDQLLADVCCCEPKTSHVGTGQLAVGAVAQRALAVCMTLRRR